MIRGRLLVEGRLRPGRLRIEDGRIAAVELESDSEGASDLPIVAPGLVDLHVHGFGGADPLEDLDGMARALALAGTTGFLPTLFPEAPARLGATAERVWGAARGLAAGGARVLGLHLEGPFVSPAAAGSLPAHAFAVPSPAALREILGDGDGRGVRAVTLAPELAGSAALVRELAGRGIRVSLGHSLASAAEARAAAAAGATGVTHLFNAMAPWHHRRPGLAGFALSSDALAAEIIGDLVHVGPEALGLALAARGPAGLALVSDALRGAGTGCEAFESHGHRCVVSDGAAWIEGADGGRRLAGAALSQLEAVRGLVAAGVVSAEEALVMGAETPARSLGLEDELGRLVPGARADLIVLRGPGLELAEVLVGGAPPAAGPGRR